ncbi:MAG: SRPBCC domain-containing protein [Microbacteriaceae bacterium]|nr:SRPBCC domain-containing protein [Microbacteriaceae bacterium]
MTDTTGKTADAGWEVGVRQTVPARSDVAWDFLLGEGLPLWLGDTTLPHAKGGTYRTADGVVGEVRAYTENAKVRITWRPDDWPHDTTLQVSVKEAAGGTTIVIHHERLSDREERRMMLGHWKNVASHLAAAFDPNR